MVHIFIVSKKSLPDYCTYLWTFILVRMTSGAQFGDHGNGRIQTCASPRIQYFTFKNHTTASGHSQLTCDEEGRLKCHNCVQMWISSCMSYSPSTVATLLGQSLMIGVRKKILKPRTLCVCLSVYERATGHTFWPRNLIFWVEWSLGHEEKTCFLFFFFEIFSFTLFIGIFGFFSLYNTSKSLFSIYQSQFFT